MMPVPWRQWEGQVVDQYFPLHRYIGGTDHSAVFLTQYGDPEPRNAAIKLVLASRQDAELIAQWDRAAQLSHPNLLRLLRRGNCQVNHLPLLYVVTEYADEDLATVLAERPLTSVEAREMLKPMLDALAYIHGKGLVHGHLKPANIMAVGDQLKLSVDGITTVEDLSLAQNIPGAYDRAEFSDRGCSPVGDIWSFGMTLVEVLTQQLPRQEDPKQEPILPETLPAEFVPMVRACLRPDPRRRASLDEILAHFQHSVPEPAPTPVVEARAARRKWLRPALAGAAVLGLTAIFVAPRVLRQPVTSTVAAQPMPGTAKPVVAPVVEAKAAIPAAKPPVDTPPARTRRVDAPPGQVVHQVMPQVTNQARRTIHGTVKINVRARVDASGHVASAKVESQNSRYFANLTLKAVEQWGFAPKDGAGDWLLRFEITTTRTEVRPSRLSR